MLEVLSERLTGKFGKGWTVESLTLTRKFYKTYSNSVNTVYEKSGIPSKTNSKGIVNSVDQIQNAPAEPHKFVFCWPHYLVPMRMDNPNVCELS